MTSLKAFRPAATLCVLVALGVVVPDARAQQLASIRSPEAAVTTRNSTVSGLRLNSGTYPPLRDPVVRDARRLQGGAATPATSQSKNWFSRHPALAGLLLGAGAGAAVGALSCSNAPEFAGACAAAGGGIGGGGGALVGFALSKR